MKQLGTSLRAYVQKHANMGGYYGYGKLAKENHTRDTFRYTRAYEIEDPTGKNNKFCIWGEMLDERSPLYLSPRFTRLLQSVTEAFGPFANL